MKFSGLGINPVFNTRNPELPVGLKVCNIGCGYVFDVIYIQHYRILGPLAMPMPSSRYAFLLRPVAPIQSLLKVWFRDLAFRNGVYQCQPSQDVEKKFEVRPRVCTESLTKAFL